MQREIKFRAWDKKKGRFEHGLSNLVLMLSGQLNWDFGGELKWISGLNEQYVLMQFIGFNDKNGKECYWDDLVSDGINPPFLVTPDYHLLARLSEIEFEIIGNKYENPELLEGQ